MNFLLGAQKLYRLKMDSRFRAEGLEFNVWIGKREREGNKGKERVPKQPEA